MHRTFWITTLILILALLCSTPYAFAQDRLIFAATLIRHGDRSPCLPIPSSPCEWNPDYGELTPLGINQEFLLGQSFRTRYVDELALLPAQYRYNSIYARSTDYNRTIMSAQAFLCGLYPPGTGPLLDSGSPALPGAIQPVPIRTMPRDLDRLLLGQDQCEKKYRDMIYAYLHESAEWQQKNAAYADRFPRWSRIFGVNIKSLMSLLSSADNVNVRLLKGVPLPEGLTEEEAREIVKLADWAMARAYRSWDISRLIAGDFMNEITAHMEKAIKGTEDYKFVLYSAHDSTVLPVMAAMGIPLEGTPHYASNVSFELYRNGDAWSVKVRFDGKDMFLPGNGGKNTCTFEQFKTVIEKGKI